MKRSKSVVCVLAALSMSFSGFALAQPHDDHRGDQRHDRRGPPHREMQHEGRGAGPDHSFYRGGRLPMEYRNHQYVVDNWRGHHLSAPPRGYHWVQTGPDYVLAAIATGVIASVLLSH